MSAIKELLRTFVDKERGYFNKLAKRLQKFDQIQQENEVAAHIYSKWFECYQIAVQRYEIFDGAAQALKAGQVQEARRLMGVPLDAPMTGTIEGDTRILTHMLINDYLGSTVLYRNAQRHNQELVNTLINLSISQPEAADDIENIICWLATFPHLQASEPDPKEEAPGFFSSIWETGIKVAIGFAIGWYMARRKPPRSSPRLEEREEEREEEGTGYRMIEGPPPPPE